MSIAVSDFNAFVSHTVSNGNCRKAHINQKADVAVSEVMDSDTLDPCRLRPSVHLMVEIAFRDGENALLLLDAVEHPQVVLHLVTEEVGHFNGGDGVEFTKKAKNKIKKYTEQGLSQLPICVAKTQYSLSDQASLLGRPTGFTVKINDIIPSAGAGFLVAISGDIMRMPGLPKRPAAVNMDIDEDGKIIGLF